jgi:hypothetical protein
MNRDQEEILEAARVLRGVLPELYRDAGGWEAVDDELSGLLNPPTEGAAARVLAVVELQPEIATWWLARERARSQPDLTDDVRGGGDAPNTGEVVAAPRFVCPRGDIVWYRRTTAVPVPRCRTHGLRLSPSRSTL